MGDETVGVGHEHDNYCWSRLQGRLSTHLTDLCQIQKLNLSDTRRHSTAPSSTWIYTLLEISHLRKLRENWPSKCSDKTRIRHRPLSPRTLACIHAAINPLFLKTNPPSTQLRQILREFPHYFSSPWTSLTVQQSTQSHQNPGHNLYAAMFPLTSGTRNPKKQSGAHKRRSKPFDPLWSQ